jgi:hypothetical protein
MWVSLQTESILKIKLNKMTISLLFFPNGESYFERVENLPAPLPLDTLYAL